MMSRRASGRNVFRGDGRLYRAGQRYVKSSRYHCYDGFRSELRAYLFDKEAGKWSEGIPLTDEGKYIRDYSVVMNEAGKLSAAVNFVEIQEEAESIYGRLLCMLWISGKGKI